MRGVASILLIASAGLLGDQLACAADSYDLWNWPPAPSGTPHVTGWWAEPDSVKNDLRWPNGCQSGEVCDQGCRYINPIHTVLFLDGAAGRIVVLEGYVLKQYDLDPSSSEKESAFSVRSTSNPHEPFCGGHCFLSSGQLLWAGGNRAAKPVECLDGAPVKYLPATEGWTSILDMSQSTWANRWIDAQDIEDGAGSSVCEADTSQPGGVNCSRYYPTVVQLPSGDDVLVMSGDFWVDANHDSIYSDTPPPADSYVTNKTWARFSGSSWEPFSTLVDGQTPSGHMPLYPRLAVLPSGLFWDGPYTPNEGSDSDSRLWPWTTGDEPTASGVRKDTRKEPGRHGAAHAVLTLAPWSSEQRVILAGGSKWVSGQDIAHKNAEWIDFGDSGSHWDSTGAFKSGEARSECNGVLLPDGKFFVVGGEDSVGGQPHTPRYSCEMLDPSKLGLPREDDWKQMASLNRPRMYHSELVLLPDGRCFATGNKGDGGTVEGKTYEIYYPPYLFNASGGYADRDSVLVCPANLYYGIPFYITLQDSAAKVDEVCLMAPSAVTHADNMTQRRVLMDMEHVGGDSLAVTAPPNGRYAPPGKYMLFALNNGVPTKAKFVNLQKGDSVVHDGETDTWFGTVRLEENFVVEQGGHLIIKPGTKILANAKAASKVKVVIAGQLVADAMGASEIIFSSWNGPATSGADWDGVSFDLVGCSWPGYGFAGCLQPPSSLKHATVENGTFGLVMKDYCVPDLEDVTFGNIVDDRHIYLESDSFIAGGYWSDGVCGSANWEPHVGTWQLGPGTRVVAANSSSQDIPVGEAGKVDFFATGDLIALGGAAASDSVWFGPESPNNSTAAEWGGLYLPQEAGEVRLEYASLGYAANPVFMFLPDSLMTLRHSRIHHFADTGLWIDGYSAFMYGTGVVVESCVVERGGALAPSLGRTGVLATASPRLILTGNRIVMTGEDLQVFDGRGLDLRLGQAYCTHPPPGGVRAILVSQNVFVGPGYIQDEQLTSFTGVYTDWLCGWSGIQNVEISNNLIYDWNTAGLWLSQSSNVNVDCNRVEEARRAVEFYRNADPLGPGVKFRRNWLAIPEAMQHVLRSDNAIKTRLGPAASGLGGNEMRTPLQRPLIRENEPGDAHAELPAEDNAWYINNALKERPADVDIEPYITTELPNPEDAPRVDVDPLLTSGDPMPWPCYPNSELPSVMVPGREQAVGADAGENAHTEASRIEPEEPPSRSAFGTPRPNPTTKDVEVTLAVGKAQNGFYQVTVFDVGGRRVAGLVSSLMSSGLYEVRWDGRDAGGRQVTSGIYFLQAEGPGLSVLRKVVVLE